ncbi:DEAD/DEAH box helicase [bacterium]|nr:DEAD/DEAH box helicase [bacterium]MCI0606728.1 DEAD/DEAH box helicase [bacterium]
MTDFLRVLAAFRRDFADRIFHHEIIDARPPVFGDFPASVPSKLVEALQQRSIAKPYSHQAASWRKLSDGKNVVVVTPTASGKTLCYNVPVVQKILEDPNTRALYLFPTKALSQDQLAELQSLLNHAAPEAKAFTFDGDTPADARRAIRAQGHIVITNPDMLHSGILPHHVKWQKLFENLKFIVLDELHSYRGVFGSHVANVMRRLKRICRFYGSAPQFICCSATIANPKEHAELILESPVELIDENGAPVGEKHFFLLNPPVVNPALGIRRSYVKESQSVANYLLSAGLHTILFAPSRLIMEILLTYLQQEQEKMVLQRGEIRGYRGGYLPSVRREIEAGLRSGEIKGVVSTNALELGIDIGSLDASILAGYPGTISSSWQQAGRSGRRDKSSMSVLVATSSPVDQFLVHNPEYFFEASPEHARINPDNLHILVDHIKCSSFEMPFHNVERFGKEDLTEILTFLREEGFLHETGEAYHWIHEAYPANAVSLRRITSDNFLVVDTSKGDEIIAEVDFTSGLTTLHEKAIYMCEGVPYYVDQLDFEGRKALVRPVQADYYTDAITYTDVKVLDIFETQESAVHRPCHGEIQVTEEVVGFKKLKLFTLENVGAGELSLPEREWHTTSFWFTLTRELLDQAPFESEEKIDAVRGLAYGLRSMAVIYLMCDVRDLGVAVIDTLQDRKIYQHQLRRRQSDVPARDVFQPNIYLYDKYPGGIGFSKTLYDIHPTLFQSVESLVQRCDCINGCPSCIGAPLIYSRRPKEAILYILSQLNSARISPPYEGGD